jgi:hypothetical protein
MAEYISIRFRRDFVLTIGRMSNPRAGNVSAARKPGPRFGVAAARCVDVVVAAVVLMLIVTAPGVDTELLENVHVVFVAADGTEQVNDSDGLNADPLGEPSRLKL